MKVVDCGEEDLGRWGRNVIGEYSFMALWLVSHVPLFATSWTVTCQAPLFSTDSQNLFKLMSIDSVIPSSHFILCCPLLLLPSIFPSIRVLLFNESALGIRWPEYWSFSLNITVSNEYSGWFPLGLTGLISLQPKGLSRVLSSTTGWKHQILWDS